MVSVRPSEKQKHAETLTLVPGKQNMRENNDNLLAVAWWVILNSLDLY